MKLPAKRNLVATALTACVLGLVTSPLSFIVVGASRSEFSPTSSFILLLPFFVSSGFLLWRYLARSPITVGGIPLLVAEILSWNTIAVTLFTVSGIGLQDTAQRIGSSSMSFLLISLLCLPLVIWRETALEAWIRRLPRAMSVGALVIVLAAATIAIAADFLIPSHLI
jgi:hypothetical protein